MEVKQVIIRRVTELLVIIGVTLPSPCHSRDLGRGLRLPSGAQCSSIQEENCFIDFLSCFFIVLTEKSDLDFISQNEWIFSQPEMEGELWCTICVCVCRGTSSCCRAVWGSWKATPKTVSTWTHPSIAYQPTSNWTAPVKGVSGGGGAQVGGQPTNQSTN